MPQFFGGIHDIDITGIMNLMNCDTDTGVIFFTWPQSHNLQDQDQNQQ